MKLTGIGRIEEATLDADTDLRKIVVHAVLDGQPLCLSLDAGEHSSLFDAYEHDRNINVEVWR